MKRAPTPTLKRASGEPTIGASELNGAVSSFDAGAVFLEHPTPPLLRPILFEASISQLSFPVFLWSLIYLIALRFSFNSREKALHNGRSAKVCPPGLWEALHRPRGEVPLPPRTTSLPRGSERFVLPFSPLPMHHSITKVLIIHQDGSAATPASSPLTNSWKLPPAQRASTPQPTNHPPSKKRSPLSTTKPSTQRSPP